MKAKVLQDAISVHNSSLETALDRAKRAQGVTTNYTEDELKLQQQCSLIFENTESRQLINKTTQLTTKGQ